MPLEILTIALEFGVIIHAHAIVITRKILKHDICNGQFEISIIEVYIFLQLGIRTNIYLVFEI